MIETLKAQPTLAIRMRCPTAELPRRVPQAVGEVYAAVQAARARPDGPAYTRYLAHNAEESYFEIEVGIPVTEAAVGDGNIVPSELPGGPAVLLWHEGPYDTLGQSFARLPGLVRELGRTSAGAPWESYAVGPPTEPDPARWRTALYQPVGP